MTIRVLVVDDSAFMRRVISEAIAAQPDMEVAGVAINGLDALVKVEQLQPDVVKDELLHKIRVAAKATARGPVVSGQSVSNKPAPGIPHRTTGHWPPTTDHS